MEKNPIETNGPSNIVSLIDVRHYMTKPFDREDMETIREMAMNTVLYMRQLEGTSPLTWGEFLKKQKGNLCPSCGSNEVFPGIETCQDCDRETASFANEAEREKIAANEKAWFNK
jgi:hypothetical protein